jgi:hypothetical protein
MSPRRVPQRITLARIALLVIFGAIPFASRAQSGEAEWYQCKVDSDCTLIKNFCGAPQGVNKKHRVPALKREEALKLGLATNPGYSCATFDRDPFPGAATTCLNNWCAISWPGREPPKIIAY